MWNYPLISLTEWSTSKEAVWQVRTKDPGFLKPVLLVIRLETVGEEMLIAHLPNIISLEESKVLTVATF